MGRKSKFDKLNDWIKAEYDIETEKIESGLSNDGSFDPDRIDSDELFQRIQARIKMEEKNERNSQGKKKSMINMNWVQKWATVVCMTIVVTFALSMRSEANRSYFMDKVQYLFGNEMVLNRGNGRDSEHKVSIKEQWKIREEIEKALDIYVPRFVYDLEVYGDDAYSIQYGDAVATIQYQCGDNIVNFRMYNKDKADMAGVDFQGRVIDELEIRRAAVTVSVLEINAPTDKEPTFAAQWAYQNGYYQLSGKVQKKEFVKILESITY